MATFAVLSEVMDDESNWPELVTRVRAGDAAAFERVFRAFVLPLCAFAYRYVGSRETAAELVQDVFYRIWRSHATWEVRDGLKAYLYRATRNRALDFLKHERITRHWAERSAVSVPGIHPGSVQPEALPDATVEADDLAAALERALDELPERRRLVFLLRWREGLSHREIADRLGVSVKTVENQLTRAIGTLRQRLGPRGG